MKCMGMMKPMVAGDIALWKLAQRRFDSLGIGAECYPTSPEHLRELLPCLPDRPSSAHLPYHLDITQPEDRDEIVKFAVAADGRLRGFTLHDHPTYTLAPDGKFLPALEQLTDALAAAPISLFIEYVSARPINEYEKLMQAIKIFPRAYPCLDVGHFAVDYCRDYLHSRCPELRLQDLSPHFASLSLYIDHVQKAVKDARAAVFKTVKRFFKGGFSQLHFHAHDAHPLSKFSPYPIRDHLSFLKQIPLPFFYEGKKWVNGIFGVAGAKELHHLIANAPAEIDISLMLEIHNQPGRIPLGEDADLFAHWTDFTHAEAMNFHLDLLQQSFNALTAFA